MASEIRFRELALEEKRIEAAQEQKKIEAEQEQMRKLRKMELELKMIEGKRLEREAEQMRLEREAHAEQKMLEIEAEYRREQMKLELEMKRLESERSRAGWYKHREIEGAGHDEEALRPNEKGHGLDLRTKHFGDTLRHVLPSMPSEISELSQFFDMTEKLYQTYQVPGDLRAKLLIPKLSSRAKSIIVRMTDKDLERYGDVKKFLLAEYKLTPREYINRFHSAVKESDETYVLFAARLRNLLMYYLRSRMSMILRECAICW